MISTRRPTGVQPGVTRVTVTSLDIRNAAGDALSANNQSVTLAGDFGNMSEPRVDRFTVVVLANSSNYTDGDTVVLHMDRDTPEQAKAMWLALQLKTSLSCKFSEGIELLRETLQALLQVCHLPIPSASCESTKKDWNVSRLLHQKVIHTNHF